MNDKVVNNLSRRQLLKGVGALMTTGLVVGTASRVINQGEEPTPTLTSQGYQESEHIQAYYRTLRGSQ